MVNYQADGLDRVFAALVDPTRRAILARLEREESVSIGALAARFPIKLPAVMKPRRLQAGLVTRSNTAPSTSDCRRRRCARPPTGWPATSGSGRRLWIA
jgi:DNA-binding transcriptional ArsR family regulator